MKYQLIPSKMSEYNNYCIPILAMIIYLVQSCSATLTLWFIYTKDEQAPQVHFSLELCQVLLSNILILFVIHSLIFNQAKYRTPILLIQASCIILSVFEITYLFFFWLPWNVLEFLPTVADNCPKSMKNMSKDMSIYFSSDCSSFVFLILFPIIWNLIADILLLPAHAYVTSNYWSYEFDLIEQNRLIAQNSIERQKN